MCGWGIIATLVAKVGARSKLIGKLCVLFGLQGLANVLTLDWV